MTLPHSEVLKLARKNSTKTGPEARSLPKKQERNARETHGEKRYFHSATLPWFLNTLFIASYTSTTIVVILLFHRIWKKQNLPFGVAKKKNHLPRERWGKELRWWNRRGDVFFSWAISTRFLRFAYGAVDLSEETREKLSAFHLHAW